MTLKARLDGVFVSSTSMTALFIYRRILDDLREARRQPDWKPENDREALASLEDLYDALTDEERSLVESESDRSWPDLWDARYST